MAEDTYRRKQAEQTSPPLNYPEFTPPTYEEWRKVAEASLKGAPFDKKVITKTFEEIDLQPVYWQQDVEKLTQLAAFPGQPPYLRGSEAAGSVGRAWEVCQELRASTPEAFNEEALFDLAHGQTALGLVLDRPTRMGIDVASADAGEVGVEGLSLASLGDLETALRGIDLTATPLHVLAGASALPLVAQIAAFARHTGSLQSLRGCVGADPLGELARVGELRIPLESAYDSMAALLTWARVEAPSLRTVMVQGCPYHEAGASAVQELAFALATGVEYLRALSGRGIETDLVAPAMRFTFSLGSNLFMEIAKLRAARMLWSRIIEVFGGGDEAQRMNIHGRTSAYTKTIFDPYVNMLRNTTEAFAGVIGGVDSLHVRPFDEPIRPPDEFSRRVSRNVQLLLRLESHLTHPIDPAGGSWYVETLTDQLAQGAWTIFQEIERRGGMFRALTEGFPQSESLAVANRRQAGLSTRKDVVVGTNFYANLQETRLEPPTVDREALLAQRCDAVARYRETAGDEAARQAALRELASSLTEAEPKAVEAATRAARAGATLSELYRAHGEAVPRIYPLARGRAAEPYERIRTGHDRWAESTGKRIRVFLANIGPIAQHKARADFTQGFFEVGGFEVLKNDGFATAAEAADAALESDAEVVVICSTDAIYPEVVPELTRIIKASRPETTVILAGKPADEHRAAYDEAGLDSFIFIKSNCLELLENLLSQKGVRHA